MLEGMDDYTAAADKLLLEVHHFERALERSDTDLALAAAKRVRSASTLAVRALARHRDALQAQEVTSA